MVLTGALAFALLVPLREAVGFGGDGIGTMPSQIGGGVLESKRGFVSWGVEGTAADLTKAFVNVSGNGQVEVENGAQPGTYRVWFRGALTISADRGLLESGRLKTVIETTEAFGRGVAASRLEGSAGPTHFETFGRVLELPIGRISGTGLIDRSTWHVHLTSQRIRHSHDLRVTGKGALLEIAFR